MVLAIAFTVPQCSHADTLPDLSLENVQGRPSMNGQKISRTRVRSRGALGDELQLDTVDNILLSSSRRSTFPAFYRGAVYKKLLNETTGIIDTDDDDDSRAIAEKLFMYQSTFTLTEFIVNSPLAPLYRRVISNLKELRDTTTVKVSRDQRGSLALNQGMSTSAKKGERLIELKVHGNVQTGLEPRLIVNKNVMVRHNLWEGETLLEYRIDF